MVMPSHLQYQDPDCLALCGSIMFYPSFSLTKMTKMYYRGNS